MHKAFEHQLNHKILRLRENLKDLAVYESGRIWFKTNDETFATPAARLILPIDDFFYILDNKDILSHDNREWLEAHEAQLIAMLTEHKLKH